VIAKLDAAPYDDEELSEEDREAVRQARSEPGISWSEAAAKLRAG
jgi:ribosome-binding protein aMBF1 (putative translation factor)